MAALAAGAAIVSYNDGLFLVRLAGIAGRVGYLYPLLPDGLIIISWASVYEAGLSGIPRPRWAVSGIALGACLTLAMNVGAGILHNGLQPLIDGVVPVVLFVALEILMGLVKRGRGTLPPDVAAIPAQCPHTAAASLDEAVRLAYEHERDCEGSAHTFVALAARFAIDRKRVAELVKPPAPAVPVAALNGSAP
jgi:Protein of unknown function (DUF2637)